MGEFDLTTGLGDELKEFDGKIGQMRYWTNLIYTDKTLSGDECIGLSGKELLSCNFKRDGINSLHTVRFLTFHLVYIHNQMLISN